MHSQRIARKDKTFLSYQYQEIEKINRMGKTTDHFKKIRDTKGNFHANRGTIKDRNGINVTELEKTNKECNNTQINYTQKTFMIQLSTMV